MTDRDTGISDNKMNALSDDALSAVTGGGAYSFKTLDELNAMTARLSYTDTLTIGDVTYHYADAISQNFVLFMSDTGARLWVPERLFQAKKYLT